MLVFWTEYLAISFPQACRPAFCTALCKIYQFGFYQVVTAYINHLVSHANLCDLWQWKTDNLEPLPFPDDGFQKAQRRRLGIFRFPFGELLLISTFHAFPGFAPSFCHPNQNFFAWFWVILKLQVTPAQFPGLMPSPETKVKGKEPPQCTPSALGLWQPNSPFSNIFYSSSVVNSFFWLVSSSFFHEIF